jgi:hypothetical protein
MIDFISTTNFYRIVFTVLSFCIFNQAQVNANPWLLPPGTMVISARYDYAYADQEFLANDGTLTPFSLNGEYQSSSYTLGARIGISDYFEIEASLPLKSVSYEADPLILLPSSASGEEAFDYYQENIIDFNQSITGFGDLSLAARFRTSVYPIASSIELKLTAPTGYRGPQGTFGSSPTTVEQFVEDVGDYVKPSNIRDDVTLGDGVFSFQPIIHLGFGTSTGFFVRTSSGILFRNQGAGEIFTSEFKVGQLFTSWFLVYAGIYVEKTITKGRPIGISVAAEDAKLPAADYVGLNNLKPIMVSLDRDLTILPLGVLFRPLPKVDIVFTYAPVLQGRNVAKSQSFSMGISLVNEL